MSSQPLPRAIVLLHAGAGAPVRLTAVERSTRCDLGLVDDLMRIQVLAARFGWTVEITHVSNDLRDLFDLVGLSGQVATG